MTKIQRIVLCVLLCLFNGGEILNRSHMLFSAEMQALQEKKNVRIVLTPPEIDFGNINTGEIVSAMVSIHNPGDSALRIDTIKADITQISTSQKHISLEPQERVSLEITLDATNMHGNLRSRIVFNTNDDENNELILMVRANIKPLIAFQQPAIFVGQIARTAKYLGRALLIGKLIEEERLSDFEIKTSSPAIEVQIQNPRVNQTGLTVEFVINPELKAGTFKETITIVSNSPPAEAQLQLMGQKLGIIQVTPDRYEFFPIGGKMPKKLEIIFECEKIFKITKVEDLSQSLKLSLKTLKKGKKYRLTARLRKGLKTGILGVVKIYTDLEEHPLIHIPVLGGR